MNTIINRNQTLPVATQDSSKVLQVDALVTRFIEEASDPKTLAALTVGSLSYRGVKTLIMGSELLSVQAGRALRPLAIFSGLGAEVISYEGVSRGFLSLSGDSSNPDLWKWNGEGGWAKGLATSAVTFSSLKGAGSLVAGENWIFQQAFQSSAMVAGRQLTATIGLTAKPQGDLGQQWLEAAVTNLQMTSGMSLAQGIAPGLFALERSLDLWQALSSERATGWSPLSTAPASASIVNEGVNLHSEGMSPFSKWKSGSLQMAGPREKGLTSQRPGQIPSAPPLNENQLRSEKEFQKIKLVALGDIHSDWQSVQKILDHEFPEGNGTSLSVGDLETYPPLLNGHQLHFIYGNHENFPLVAQMHAGRVPSNKNYHPIFAGDLLRLGDLNISGLPGNYSPKFFEKPRKAPPKHFLPEHFDKAKALPFPLDIFLIHEAPKDVGFRKGGKDLGNPLLTGLIEYLNPRLVFFGHHHRRFEGIVGDTRIVGLDYPKRSYVVIDYDPLLDRLELTEKVANPIDTDGKQFQFPWEEGKNEGARLLFKGGFSVEKEKRIQELLETRYRDSVIQTMEKHLLTEVTGKDEDEKTFRAKTRASLAVNESLPFVARYMARLEEDPKLSIDDRKKILGEIFEEMTPNSLPAEISDDVRAFGEFLKALKIQKP
jgi:hypothetical protein